MDAIGPGRIVGVKAGHVSLVTEGADSLLVTTDRAVVVGNVSKAGDNDAETVALIGQVKLQIASAVRSGDFIVPSGRNDGIGHAIPPTDITPALAPQVVGRAWEDKEAGESRAVTVAVGVQGADAMAALGAALAAQEQKIVQLHEALREVLSGASKPEG